MNTVLLQVVHRLIFGPFGDSLEAVFGRDVDDGLAEEDVRHDQPRMSVADLIHFENRSIATKLSWASYRETTIEEGSSLFPFRFTWDQQNDGYQKIPNVKGENLARSSATGPNPFKKNS